MRIVLKKTPRLNMKSNTEINKVFIIGIFLLKNKNRKTDCLEQNGTKIMETSWKETKSNFLQVEICERPGTSKAMKQMQQTTLPGFRSHTKTGQSYSAIILTV